MQYNLSLASLSLSELLGNFKKSPWEITHNIYTYKNYLEACVTAKRRGSILCIIISSIREKNNC